METNTRALSDVQRPMLVFAPYRLDVSDERLFRDREPIPLKPKALKVLLRLLAAHGKLVTKRELLRDVWSDVTVGESVLKVCISELRAALSDDADSPVFVQTVHGRGYRFIAPVEELELFGADSPRFVGRLRERDDLLAAMQRAAARGGELVLITGEPGIGKTALLEAFLRQVEGLRDAWISYGRCTAHVGQREPYMPVLEGIGRLARSADAAIVIPALLKFAPTWAIHLQGLLSADDAARAREQAAFATLGRMLREMGDLIEELGRTKLFVLSIEDVHWSDRATLELLEYLAKRRSNMRALIVGTSRSWECEPAAELERPDPLFSSVSASVWQELALAPLSLEEIEQLVGKWFEGANWAGRVAEALHRRTGGNPLFLNSVLNHQLRTGSFRRVGHAWKWVENAQAWLVPNELRGFIQHWFTQRSSLERRVLGAASVVGSTFEADLMAPVLELGIEEVRAQMELQCARGFFDQNGLAEGRGYRFAHPLIREVLYESLPVATRARYHLSIARCLGRDAPSARLAYHLEEGGAPVEAIEHQIRAGEAAHSRYAYHDAVHHFERALSLLRRAPESAERDASELKILLAIGQPLVNIHGWTAARVESSYRRAYELCRDVRGAQHFASLAGLYKFFLARGLFETAAEIAERCHACAVELGYRPLVMTGHATRGFAYYYQSDLKRARRELETARALYDAAECQSFAQIFGDDPAVGVFGFLARVEHLEGNLDVAAELAREAVALARRLAHPHVIATALALRAHIEAWVNHDAAVAEIADELTRVSRSQSFALWGVIAKFFSAWVRSRSGHHNALSEAFVALSQYDAIGALADRTTYALLFARLLRDANRSEDCAEFVKLSLVTGPRVHLWDERLRELHAACGGS